MNIEHGNFIQGPVWHIHKDCKITTPMDKLINRLCEKHRRITSSHHGSCGMGIFETVDRSANRTPLYAKDAFSQSLMDLLYCIYNEGIEVLTERGMPQYILREYVHYFETRVINNFCLEFQTLLTESVIVDSFLDLTQHYDHFVFEGGQGLRLHQDNIDEFPHVTPSCTGIDNIIPLLMHSTDINVHYMTRWYLTRHGAGSLQGEVPIDHPICLAAMHSHIRETNTANMYQGQFRYAPLNWNALMSAVNSDVIKYAQYNSTVNLNITHWDTAVASGLVNQAEYLSSLQSLNCAKRFLGFIDRTWVSF
jgi:adenylosuccinate synthase